MKIAPLVVTAFLAMATTALAQNDSPTGPPGAMASCDAFAKQTCPNMQANERRMCLEANSDKASAGCKAMLAIKPPRFPGNGTYPR